MSMINKRELRTFLLDYAARGRAHKFTRVGAERYPQAEAVLREWARRTVDRLPSKGKTI